jgi:hypothetical protein
MDPRQSAEPWMVGHFCDVCDAEIEAGEQVRVLDIDWSDRAGRAVATIAHDACVAVAAPLVK